MNVALIKAKLRNRLVMVSAFIYAGVGFLFLVSLPMYERFTSKPLSGFAIGIALAFAVPSLIVACGMYRAYSGTSRMRMNMLRVAMPVTVFLAGFSGWKGAIVYLTAYFLAAVGMWELWKKNPADPRSEFNNADR
jgi:hypothetical protein